MEKKQRKCEILFLNRHNDDDDDDTCSTLIIAMFFYNDDNMHANLPVSSKSVDGFDI